MISKIKQKKQREHVSSIYEMSVLRPVGHEGSCASTVKVTLVIIICQ